MVHWKRLTANSHSNAFSRSNRSPPRTQKNQQQQIAPSLQHSIVFPLIKILEKLSQNEVKDAKVENRQVQTLVQTLSDLGLLNHNKIEVEDGSIIVNQVFQRLQKQSSSQGSTNGHSVGLHRQRSSLLRLLAKPYLLSKSLLAPESLGMSSTANVDISFQPPSSKFPLNHLSKEDSHKELYCQQELVRLQSFMRELKSSLREKNAVVLKLEKRLQQQVQFQEVQSQQHQHQQLIEDLKSKYLNELDAATKAAKIIGREEEKQAQLVSDDVQKLWWIFIRQCL